MSANDFVDACGFITASSGTGNFVVSAAVQGYQTPSSASAVNANVYSYRAESADKSQWEEGFGAYTVSTTTLARTTITANSSGGTTALNFTAPPNVYITATSADLKNASLLTSGTIPQGVLPSKPTISICTQTSHSGGFSANASGTYTLPAGVRWVRVTMVGGGGGGGGANNTTAATSGGATTLGAGPLWSAGGGDGGKASNPGVITNGGAIAGSNSFDWSAVGSQGAGGGFAISGSFGSPGGHGGASSRGGSGGSAYGIAGGNASANSGSGGGGGAMPAAVSTNAGAGGASGATGVVTITSPAATYAYAVGAGGAGAAAGTSGTAGGSGAGGIIIIEEYYL